MIRRDVKHAKVWTPGRDLNPRVVGCNHAPCRSATRRGGVGYGIRTRVSGVKVRSPRPLADNPTQNLGRATLSKMRLGVAGENRTHDAQVHSLRRQAAGDGHTEAHIRSDRVMSWSVLRDSNPHLTVWKTDMLPLNTKEAHGGTDYTGAVAEWLGSGLSSRHTQVQFLSASPHPHVVGHWSVYAT